MDSRQNQKVESFAVNVVLKTQALTKTFHSGNEMFHAVKGVNLQVKSGEFVAIMGPSGSGKSTLLHMLCGLEKATYGSVTIRNVDLSQCDDEELTTLRRDRIGFIFQFFNLIPILTAYENVTLPLLMANHEESRIRERATLLLTQMGLGNHLHKRPHELSGGQQQRVAIARALLPQPLILMADEPTGSLDTKTGMEVLQLLRNVCTDQQHSLVLVTHDPRVASFANRVLFMKDGEIVGEMVDTAQLQDDDFQLPFSTAIQQKWEVLMS